MAQMGRPKKFDSPEKIKQLKELMRLKPTLEDTAAFFDCGTTTVEDFIRKEFDSTFREFREKHLVHTRLHLIREAIQRANRSDTMLIFCLKNLCKWSDKYEEVSDSSKKIVINYSDADKPPKPSKEVPSK